MEKVCEFCVTLRSVIYCKADAAHLCLPCDAKVHSANPLSSRHPRTLVCESCKYRPSYVRCYDHQLFMCRGCDQSQHDFSTQHRKTVISGYIGCPSAHDLATLWGYKLNEFGGSDLQDNFVSASDASLNRGIIISGSSSSTVVAKSEVGPSSRHPKAFNSSKPKENPSYIMQQLLRFKKPQVKEDCERFSLIRHQGQTDISSSSSDPLKLENNFNQNFQHLKGLGNDLQHMNHPPDELNFEPYVLPFSPLDELTSPTADGSHLQGDSFWQCKSPVRSGQLWTQNMQDLGVCEELGCLDDLNIPDIDVTFRNFEDLFRGEQAEQTADEVMVCSSVETNMSLDRSDSFQTTKLEGQGTSVASFNSISQSYQIDKLASPPKRYRSSRSEDCLRLLKPSYSALSFSVSRLGAKSSGTDYMDTGLSPILFNREPSCRSPEELTAEKEVKGKTLTTPIDNKDDQRNVQKQGRCAYRKPRSDTRKRVKSQILKVEGYERDAIDHMARSY